MVYLSVQNSLVSNSEFTIWVCSIYCQRSLNSCGSQGTYPIEWPVFILRHGLQQQGLEMCINHEDFLTRIHIFLLKIKVYRLQRKSWTTTKKSSLNTCTHISLKFWSCFRPTPLQRSNWRCTIKRYHIFLKGGGTQVLCCNKHTQKGDFWASLINNPPSSKRNHLKISWKLLFLIP